MALTPAGDFLLILYVAHLLTISFLANLAMLIRWVWPKPFLQPRNHSWKAFFYVLYFDINLLCVLMCPILPLRRWHLDFMERDKRRW
jgi:hypothetical protein